MRRQSTLFFLWIESIFKYVEVKRCYNLLMKLIIFPFCGRSWTKNCFENIFRFHVEVRLKNSWPFQFPHIQHISYSVPQTLQISLSIDRFISWLALKEIINCDHEIGVNFNINSKMASFWLSSDLPLLKFELWWNRSLNVLV